MVLDQAKEPFSNVGVSISNFIVENIALPPEVEKYVDKKSAMGVIGDMKTYTEFQVADSIPDAAANPGGIAGLGAGFVMGKKIAGSMFDLDHQTNRKEDDNIRSDLDCSSCKFVNPAYAKFCINCGNALAKNTICSTCKTELPKGAKFCISCGKALETKKICIKCGYNIDEGASFCMECGTKI